MKLIWICLAICFGLYNYTICIKINTLNTQCEIYSDKISSLQQELQLTKQHCDSLQKQIDFMVE